MNRIVRMGIVSGLTGLCFLVMGCGTMRYVNSDPPGAKIFVDGADSGKTTPDKVWVSDLSKGIHYITVEKEGYKSITPPQAMKVQLSTGKILGSIVFLGVPVPFELAGDQWKESYPRRLMPFYLERQMDRVSVVSP